MQGVVRKTVIVWPQKIKQMSVQDTLNQGHKYLIKTCLSRQSKTICFRFTQYVRERTWYVLYLDDARWLPMMRRVPRSILPRNPKKFLSLYFHRTWRMRCPVIKMWPRRIIFSFSVSSTAFGFFILVKAASEGDRVLTEGGWWLKYTIACAANGRF